MINSFRFRLTVWYVLLFSVLFVVFSLFLHSVLSRALERRLDDALAVEANTTAAMMLDEFQENKGNIPAASTEAVGGMRLRGSLVAVFSGNHLLASSTPLPQPQVDFIASRAAADAAGDLALAVPQFTPNGARASVHRVAVGGQDYLVVALQSRDELVEDLAVLRRVIFLALPLVIALAGFGGYWLATRSLAPLGWMAEQAHRITGSNLNTRLGVGNAAEELAVLAASFNELLSRLDLSFESMRRFVADASHELRTPLSIIRGEADVALSHDRNASEYRESLAIILDESRRLSSLVDDLLNLARADAGRVKLQSEEFYLNDLLAECCRSAQSLAAARGVTLECRTAGDTTFRGDEQLLRRLVMNLLDNAIRYTPSGGKVSAALETHDSELSIRIADTGIGIAPDAAPHVFERFYRADTARSRQDGGFGLGLAIVKWIAESHHGDVALATNPGAGSTFTVTLPR
jgi:heavy metal sensor kinase